MSDIFTKHLWCDQIKGNSFGGAYKITQSVQRLTAGWIVRRSKPGRGEVFRAPEDRPRGPRSVLCDGYRLFLGGKAAGGVALTTHPILEPRVLNGWSYTSASPCTSLDMSWGDLYLYGSVGEMRNAYRIVVRDSEDKRPLAWPSVCWTSNVKIHLREIVSDEFAGLCECVDEHSIYIL